MLAWTVVIQRLHWEQRTCFSGDSFTCLLARGLSSSPHRPFHKALQLSLHHGSWLPLSKRERARWKLHCLVLSTLSSRRYCNFYISKVCGNPASSKSIGARFSIAYAHFMSVCQHSLAIKYFLLLWIHSRCTYLWVTWDILTRACNMK